MSIINTITQSERPITPVDGSLFYETDTNRLVVFANNAYHVYNPDAKVVPTSGEDDLNYPGGIFTNPQATYYLPQTPVVHLDSNYISGRSTSPTFTQDGFFNSGTHGSLMKHWICRTQNHTVFIEDYSGHDATLDLNISGTLSGGNYNGPCVFGNQGGFSGTVPNFSEISSGTIFSVMKPAQNTAYVCKTSPFTFSTANFNTLSAIQRPFASTESVVTSFGTDVDNVTDSVLTKPRLTIARRDASLTANNTQHWFQMGFNPAATRAPQLRHADTDSVIHSGGQLKIFQGNITQQLCWEIIIFNEALPIESINAVKNYLQNKYAGMNDTYYFPASGPMVDLTE